jgi:hypothetical protein
LYESESTLWQTKKIVTNISFQKHLCLNFCQTNIERVFLINYIHNKIKFKTQKIILKKEIVFFIGID